ncbi:uncharacterized protein LOC120351912 [Nilaparvata lugens]|uniref:uncharacterized protein LOC120351912 n=1 Tax=Nilaparvata lugens TaxID=108931 RepID=UPI00193D9D13|nr:uncharacterized protein LOC120351912 [Nilaparvata lugens]
MSEEIQKLKSKIENNTVVESSLKPIEVGNKIEECCLENKQSYSEVLKSASKNNSRTNNIREGRVLLLTSSHRRECSNILDKTLKHRYNIQSFYKPGAPIKAVVESAREQTKDFGKNDFLIVLGGSNNINEPNLDHLPEVTEKINDVPLSLKTNVIISTIASRFDRPELNQTISQTNIAIHKTINNQKNKNSKQLGVCFLNERLERENFTNHGLHLNRSGKVIFCKRLAEMIESRLQSSRTSLVTEPFLVKWLKTGRGN